MSAAPLLGAATPDRPGPGPLPFELLHALIADLQGLDSAVHTQADTMLLQPALQFRAVKPSQRCARQIDFKAAAVPEEGVHENFARVAQADAFWTLIQGAGQHNAPETCHGSRRLPVRHQPILEGRVGVGQCSAETG